MQINLKSTAVLVALLGASVAHGDNLQQRQEQFTDLVPTQTGSASVPVTGTETGIPSATLPYFTNTVTSESGSATGTSGTPTGSSSSGASSSSGTATSGSASTTASESSSSGASTSTTTEATTTTSASKTRSSGSSSSTSASASPSKTDSAASTTLSQGGLWATWMLPWVLGLLM